MREQEIFRVSLWKAIPMASFLIAMSSWMLVESFDDFLMLCAKPAGLIMILISIRFIVTLPFLYISLDNKNLIYSSGKTKKLIIPWKMIESIDLSPRSISYKFIFRRIKIPNISIVYLTKSKPKPLVLHGKIENSPYYRLPIQIQFLFKDYKILQKRIQEFYSKYNN